MPPPGCKCGSRGWRLAKSTALGHHEKMAAETTSVRAQTTPTLVFETLSEIGLLIAYHCPEDPTDAEWDEWLSATDALCVSNEYARLLVLSEGGHPNGAQLARLETSKRRREQASNKWRSEPLTAIVSESASMRFVISAVTFLNPRVRCYSPLKRSSAYAYLGIGPAEAKIVDAAVARLRVEIRTPAALDSTG